MALQIDAVTGEMRDVPDIDLTANPTEVFAEIERRKKEAEARRAGTLAVQVQDQAINQAGALGLPQVDIGVSPPGSAVAPMAPMAPAAPMVQPAGGKVQRINRSEGTSTQSTEITDEERAATGKSTRLAEIEAAQAQNRSDMLGTIQQIAASEERVFLEERQRRIDRAVEESNNKIDAEGARRAELEKQFESMQVTDFFKDEKGGTRSGALIMSAIARGLGAFASGMNGMPNFANEIIENKIQQHFAIQRARIQNMGEKVAMAKAREEDSVVAKRRMLEDVALTEAGAREKIANRASALMAKAGLTPEQIQQQEVVSANLQRASDIRLALAQATRKRITDQAQKEISIGDQQTFGVPAMSPGGIPLSSELTGKPLSQDERKALGFATRMKNALDIMQRNKGLSPEGSTAIRAHLNREKVLGEKGVAVANLLKLEKNLEQKLSTKDQETWRALQEFARASLRRESGAAIGAAEKLDSLNAYGRQEGEAPEVAQQRLQSAAELTAGTFTEAGRPSAFGGSLPAQAAPAAPPPQGRRIRLKDGRTGTLNPDGTFTPDA